METLELDNEITETEIPQAVTPNQYRFACLKTGVKFNFAKPPDFIAELTPPLTKGNDAKFTDSEGKTYSDSRFNDLWTTLI